ncbi:MAG: hypothetical protein DSZ21_01840 [Tenericutes bacterium]|nr:MAG: hypothetical protein DSZ21_01840 [Mycoplasmatota bacterium]
MYEKDEAKYHLIDFHAETTAEKKVFGLYVDGKASAFVGTHTHVQTAVPFGNICSSAVWT